MTLNLVIILGLSELLLMLGFLKFYNKFSSKRRKIFFLNEIETKPNETKRTAQ